MLLAARNADRESPLGDRIRVADTWWSRLWGLIGSPPLEPGEGLLLRPCRSVHMYWMRYGVDVAFLDRNGRVVACYPDLRPGRRSRWHRGAVSAMELPAGTLEATGTREGDTIICQEAAV